MKKIGAVIGILLVMFAVTYLSASPHDALSGILGNTFRDNYVFKGAINVGGLVAKSASFTMSAEEQGYEITSSGGTVTATLPDPTTTPVGTTWPVYLKTAGTAVTFSAAPYSLDGATSNASMDAAGDTYTIYNNGVGYVFLSRYIH